MQQARSPDLPAMYITLDSERKKKNRIAQRKSRQKKQANSSNNNNNNNNQPSCESPAPVGDGHPYDAGINLDPSVATEAWYGPGCGDLASVLATPLLSSSSGRSSSLLSQADNASISDCGVAFPQEEYTPRTPLSLANDLDLPPNGNFDALFPPLHAAATPSSSGAIQEPTLHRAVRKKNCDIVYLLLRHGASVNILCPRGQTALHLAILQSDLKIVRLLLDNHVDITIRDEDGLTPLELAIELNNVDAVRLLLAYRARVEE